MKQSLTDEAKAFAIKQAIEHYNELVPLWARFEQALEDVPEVYEQIEEARAFFQREYNIQDEDITVLAGAKLS